MRSKTVILSAMVFALVLASQAHADIAPGPRPVQKKVGARLEVNPKAKKVTILVPRNAVQFRRGGGGAPPRNPFGLGAAPTVIVGVCLTLSLLCGGMWVVRRKGGSALMLLVSSIAFLGIGGALVANRAPIPRPAPQPQIPGITIAGEVEVIMENRRTGPVRIIVSPEMHKAMMKEMPKAKAPIVPGNRSQPRSAPVQQVPPTAKPK